MGESWLFATEWCWSSRDCHAQPTCRRLSSNSKSENERIICNLHHLINIVFRHDNSIAFSALAHPSLTNV